MWEAFAPPLKSVTDKRTHNESTRHHDSFLLSAASAAPLLGCSVVKPAVIPLVEEVKTTRGAVQLQSCQSSTSGERQGVDNRFFFFLRDDWRGLAPEIQIV